MVSGLAELQALMAAAENEHLEFKEAKSNFHFEKLVKYCAALANEGGGKMILGVTDRPPRRVVGTQAFSDLERTKAGLVERLRLRIYGDEIAHPDGRVVIFHVPARPLGSPIQYEGAYWMRAGEDLAPMTADMLKRIFEEVCPDFSAEICPRASVSDLDPEAIELVRSMWRRKSGNTALDHLPVERLLADAELVVEGSVTYAALVLMGTHRALGRYLAQAELVFEYRSSEQAGPAQQRVEHREGFLLFLDDLWNTINLRNDRQHFQDGLFMLDIPTFNEAATREAILNAVTHREYRLGGSIFVRQYARRLEIVSPGGFPPGITPENILWKQFPRNRRIADAVARCGLVERAGQGMDRIFEACILESKPKPDFTHTDNYEVWVTLHGEVQDPRFLRFLEQLNREGLSLSLTQDLLALDCIHQGQPVPEELRPRLSVLADRGVIESVKRGEYILSRRLYGFLGQKGVYTRRRGLDRKTNKALLFQHIEESGSDGANLPELMQVLPSLSRDQVQKLVQELKSEGRVRLSGWGRSGRWYAGPGPDGDASDPRRSTGTPE